MSNTKKYFNEDELTTLVRFDGDKPGCQAFSTIRNGGNFTPDNPDLKWENFLMPLHIEQTPTNI